MNGNADKERLQIIRRHVKGEPSVYGGVRVPHHEQFMDFWAMSQNHFDLLAARIAAVDPALHLAETRAERQERIEAGRAPTTIRDDAEMDAHGFTIMEGGVAVVDLVGMMTKYGGSFSAMPGGLIGLQRTLRVAIAEPQVKGAILRIDSPGGNVAGVGDLAATVADLSKSKPILAFIEDLGASAAYYAASGATAIWATKDSLIGSIGVYMVIDDWSAFFAREGVKRRVIKYGAHKGDGVLGTEVSESQIADFQRTVDELGGQFVAAVAAGRKMSMEQAIQVSDGRIHIASSAKKLGLIDAVGSFEEALAAIHQMASAKAKTPSPRPSRLSAAPSVGAVGARGGSAGINAAGGSQGIIAKENSMGTETAPPETAASVAQLKKALPDATSEFLVECLEHDCTLAQATAEWTDHLRAISKAQATEIENLKAAAAEAEEKKKAASKKPGVQPAGATIATSYTSSDSIEAWNDAVSEQMSTRKMTRDVAIREVNRKQPGLREAMLREHNTVHGRSKAAAAIEG